MPWKALNFAPPNLIRPIDDHNRELLRPVVMLQQVAYTLSLSVWVRPFPTPGVVDTDWLYVIHWR